MHRPYLLKLIVWCYPVGLCPYLVRWSCCPVRRRGRCAVDMREVALAVAVVDSASLVEMVEDVLGWEEEDVVDLASVVSLVEVYSRMVTTSLRHHLASLFPHL